MECFTNWYRVTISHGDKYEKDYILKLLSNHISPAVFIPIMYHKRGDEVVFTIEDRNVAEKLMNADGKIMANDGFKLDVKVKTAFNPLDESVEEKMRQTMVKRYDPENKALDLTNFHCDPDLRNERMGGLFRPVMIVTAISIVAENFPELLALNLSDNMICELDYLSIVVKKLPKLTSLYLAKNLIRDVRQLSYLKDLGLEELVLDGNPFCDKFKEENAYVSEVRKRLPKLLKLDGTDLSPAIGFDDPDDRSIATTKGSIMSGQEGQQSEDWLDPQQFHHHLS